MTTRSLLVVALMMFACVARAQGSCGAAGGAPAGSSPGACGYLNEALGLPAPGAPAGAGNPVDLVTGNKYRRELDLQVPGRQPFVFARHYNSRNRFAGPMGVGWSHSLETRIARVQAGSRDTVQIVQGDGRRLVFERDRSRPRLWRTAEPSEGAVEGPRVGDDVIVRWIWRRAGGVAVNFDADGNVMWLARDGDEVLSLRQRFGDPLRSVSGSGGGSVDFEYVDHPKGRRLASMRHDRGTIEWTYDETGQLASSRWPDGSEHRYRYEDPNDPLLLTSVWRIEARDGAKPEEIARYGYDPQGRAVSTWERDGDALIIAWSLPLRAGARGETTVTDGAGRVARYGWTYDAFRHRTRLLDAVGLACATCPPAPRRYRHDPAGRLIGVETPTDAWTLERDEIGRPVAAWRHASGRRNAEWLWRAGYADRDGIEGWAWLEQPSIAPGRIHRIDVERDRERRVTAVVEQGWAPRPDATDVRAWRAIDRRFEMRHLQWDDAGSSTDRSRRDLPIAWIDGPEPGDADRIVVGRGRVGVDFELRHPAGVVEELSLSDGALTAHLSAHGRRAGLVHEWDKGPVISEVTNLLDTRIRFEFDREGRLVGMAESATPGGPGRERVVADPWAPTRIVVLSSWRGRATRVALPDGSIFERGFDDFARVVWIAEPGASRRWADYDSTDRLIAHQPGDGSRFVYRRDPAGRLVESRRIGSEGETVLGRYAWDGNHLVEASNDTTSIRYDHDWRGRLTATEHRFADAPDRPLRWRWLRDERAGHVDETLPDGRIVRYELSEGRVAALDVAGRRIEVASLVRPMRLRPSVAVPRTESLPRFEGERLVEAAGVAYRPDPHGRRATKQATDPARTRFDRRFVHHDWRLRAESDPSGRLRQWLWADDRPVALLEGDALYTIVTDERRAPVQALDRSGRVAWQAEYDRDGAAKVAPGARIDIPLRLPGQYFDAESGLHHNVFRTYDPARGHYLERDLLGLQPDWTRREDITLYASGDPVGHADPWGLARITYVALTTDARGRPIGRTRGFDDARWSFMIEDIAPVPLLGGAGRPPQPAGIDAVLFDPWGDFVGGRDAAGIGTGNGVDAIVVTGTTGRDVFASFVAHYGEALATTDRFVVDAFDDRRAGALALILSAPPVERSGCIQAALRGLPAFSPSPTGTPFSPNATRNEPNRLIACAGAVTPPITYRDDMERWRVERLQIAAELQESPMRSIADPCARPGCAAQDRVVVNDRQYTASYGRTQFTVTTFLAEITRLAVRPEDADAAALRAAIGLDRAIALGDRAATVRDALALARSRVDAAYRIFPTLRNEFGRGVDEATAIATWNALPEARRARFTADTGLGRNGFVDILGYRATGTGGVTEEEGRHALAASAIRTVNWTEGGRPAAFERWLVDLFGNRDPYDHVSRAFLRDNLRRVLDAPALAGRFTNDRPAGTAGWSERQDAIELDLARRVAVLHNSGSTSLALRPDLEAWLTANRDSGLGRYVSEFTAANEAGNWDALRCAPGLAAGRALQMASLAQTFAPPPPPRPQGGRGRR
ncbi:MAG: hypothetical protein RJA99_1249 [Pseudomonadota bacterium]|jgi:RHS repeat-associated protein